MYIAYSYEGVLVVIRSDKTVKCASVKINCFRY